MSHSVVCPMCGWQQNYYQRTGAERGLRRHLARGCGPVRRGGFTPERDASRVRNEGLRWGSRAAAAGFREHTFAEWVMHPTALDDLLRVMGGTPVRDIDKERRVERALRQEAV